HRPWIDDFSSGYMQRMMAAMPRQGDREPWLNTQRYHSDLKFIAKAPVDDDVMQFHKAPARVGSST
ncbi:MAG: FAD-containing monooxygenase EthA, partial [Ilumatobacter sp.]